MEYRIRLVQVSDAATAPTYKDAHHFVDTRNWSVSGGDYSYDRCGNMVHDRNRGLTYRYDLNHQPCAIGTRGRTKRLRYTDDGVKLHEHYDYPPYFAEPSPPGSTDVTECLDYCGDVTYRDGRLHSLSFGGGYLTFAGDSVSGCHYFVSDHLGNVRAVVSDADSVEQVNHYYPFGILMGESRGGDVQRRKFGGKELDREWGLDLFDFEARRFDGMRFTQPDPLAEKYPDTSPYAFCLNNPL